MEFRNSAHPDDQVPVGLLSGTDAEVLCKWLCRYVIETRKENGDSPSLIRQLLAAIQRILKKNKVPLNIFDKSDLRFLELHNTLDVICVGLRKKGIGAEVHHADMIPMEHEERMWSSGVLGVDTPKSLLRAVFYIVGLHFCLCGGQEHHDLRVEQLCRFPSDGTYCKEAYYQYVENGSKNYQGNFSEVGQENKVVRAYAQPGLSRCPVKVLPKQASSEAACILPAMAAENAYIFIEALVQSHSCWC